MTDQLADDLVTYRITIDTWNALCLATNPDGPDLSLPLDWNELIEAGIATEPETLEPLWERLLEVWATSPVVFRLTSTYRDLAYEAVLAVGALNVCVLKRSRTEAAADATLRKVAHDPHLEVAATAGHPWRLVRRVLPPLETLRAAPKQSPASATLPLTLSDQARADVIAAFTADPELSTAEALRSADIPPHINAALDAEASTSWLLTVATGETMGVGLGSYTASEEHLYRATFGPQITWDEVRPGDLGYCFEFHLLGAMDAVRRANDKEASA